MISHLIIGHDDDYVDGDADYVDGDADTNALHKDKDGDDVWYYDCDDGVMMMGRILMIMMRVMRLVIMMIMMLIEVMMVMMRKMVMLMMRVIMCDNYAE